MRIRSGLAGTHRRSTPEKITAPAAIFKKTVTQQSEPKLAIAGTVPDLHKRLIPEVPGAIVQAWIDLAIGRDVQDRPWRNATVIPSLEPVFIVA